MGGGEIGEGVGKAGDIVFGHLIAAVAAADGDRHPRVWQTGDLAGETGRRLGQRSSSIPFKLPVVVITLAPRVRSWAGTTNRSNIDCPISGPDLNHRHAAPLFSHNAAPALRRPQAKATAGQGGTQVIAAGVRAKPSAQAQGGPRQQGWGR